MTSGITPPTHGQLVSAGKLALGIEQKERADRLEAAANAMPRGDNGRMLPKITEEQWDWVIDRVRYGDTDANIIAALGVTHSVIDNKRARDPDFADRYQRALESSYIDLFRENIKVARGEPGYSSGDVRRDELICKTVTDASKRIARKFLGDRVQVDHASVTVNLPDWTGDV